MDSLFLVLGIPLLSASLALLGAKLIRRHPAIAGGTIAALFFIGALILVPHVQLAEERLFKLSWVPQLGVDLGLRMTAFTAWFGVLILLLGGCIHLYAATYFAKNPRLPSLLALLGLFTTAMLGVIWSDNFYFLFLFWEATSLLSFLLVGFHYDKAVARQNASQALLITMLGGIALLVGLIILHLTSGTASISDFLSNPPAELSTAAVLLIMLGAMTKSAQWPFHFWLPNAMVGPTPVSAYLHSATMVKAGVFLLGTFAPVLGAHPLWAPILITAGLLTITCSVLRGARATDLKAILACTTLAALGFLTILAGLATPAAMLAFVIFLTAHALYKAPLFLAAGNLEKRFGTRELPELQGAARHLKVTGSVVVFSALSLIGFAPLPGFLGKEYLLKAAWADSPLLAILVAIAAAGVLSLGFRIIFPLLKKEANCEPKTLVPLGMTVATAIPAIAALVIIIIPLSFLGQAATSLGAGESATYKFWHGWTPALLLGTSAIALSLVIVAFLKKTTTSLTFGLNFNDGFNSLIDSLRRLAAKVSQLLCEGKLVTHLALMLILIGLLSFISLDIHLWDHMPMNLGGDSMIFIGLSPLLIISTLIAARAKTSMIILVSLGFVGLIIALLFLWFSAPDLALTQLMAETLILFLLAGALAKSYSEPEKQSKSLRLICAISTGVLVTALILKSMTLEWDHPVSDFHLTQSKPAAFGANVVNVILVDFRALDTFGEIIVLAIAAMGANAALGAARKRAPLPGSSYSPLLTTGARLLSYFLIPTILWIFWRGHNAPGGGFIAALLGAAGIGIGLLVSRRRFTPSTMRRYSHRLLVIGLSIASFAALIPMLSQQPFFTGLWLHLDDLHLGTPLIFDLGVFLTVLGFCMNYLRHFHQRASS